VKPVAYFADVLLVIRPCASRPSMCKGTRTAATRTLTRTLVMD
jgi:hypothetical protein